MHLKALHKKYFWGDQEYGILPESILTFNLLICAIGISPGSPDPYILYTENQKKKYLFIRNDDASVRSQLAFLLSTQKEFFLNTQR